MNESPARAIPADEALHPIPADEALHRHAVENLDQADALLFGRVTYEMMETAWRPTAARPDWMEPFAQAISAARKYVVSSTLEQVDWNAELVRGDLGEAVQQLKRESGEGLLVGGVKLPLALTELGLIDEYEFRGASQARGPRTDVVRGAIDPRRLEACEPAGVRLGGSGNAVRAEKVAVGLARPTVIDWTQVVIAAVVGGVIGVIGWYVGERVKRR